MKLTTLASVVIIALGAAACATTKTKISPITKQTDKAPLTKAFPSTTATPEAAAQSFLDALVRVDLDAAIGFVTYPIMWDSHCRYFALEAPLRARLVRATRFGRVKPVGVEIAGRLAPGQAAPDSLDARGKADMESRLHAFTKLTGCDEETTPLLVQASRGEIVYVVAIIKNSRPASDVPALLRMRKTAVGWRVTGFEN